MHFLLRIDEGGGAVTQWDQLADVLARNTQLLVYGFTWVLWTAWVRGDIPDHVRGLLRKTRVHFVHSGGWKKLEGIQVDRRQFDDALLQTVAADSSVLDYYGLVEQVGIVYPLCQANMRHVPRWAGVVVRDPWTLDPLEREVGLLQLMNVLAFGAPYHSVLTEDLGRLIPGLCPCGRAGQRFELLGRVPKAEMRGCANI
jgi:hypothetical protein